MRKLLLALLLVMVPIMAQSKHLGLFKSTEPLIFELKEPLNDNGNWIKPDSAHTLHKLSTDTTTVFAARSETWPFSDIGLNATIYWGDTTYYYNRLINEIDGAGCNCLQSTTVILWGNDQPVKTEVTYQVIPDEVDVYFARLDAAISTRLAPIVQGRQLYVSATGHGGIDLSYKNGQLTNSDIADDFLTNQKIASGAITSSEAPNLDAAITSRLPATGGIVATAQNVLNLGGVAAGINGINEIFDNDESYAGAELHVLGNVASVTNGVKLAEYGLDQDTSFTNLQALAAQLDVKSDSLVYMTELMSYFLGSCDECTKVYLPNDGTSPKNGYEVWVSGQKKITITFGHSNNPTTLDTVKVNQNY